MQLLSWVVLYCSETGRHATAVMFAPSRVYSGLVRGFILASKGAWHFRLVAFCIRKARCDRTVFRCRELFDRSFLEYEKELRFLWAVFCQSLITSFVHACAREPKRAPPQRSHAIR